MRDKIQIQIDSAKQQIHALEIERAKLDTRLETLEEMLALAPDEDKPQKKTRKRSLSENWQNVLYLMSDEKPEGASYEEIYEMIERVGFEMKKSNLRGHMGGYKSNGYVSAVSDGVFVVTAEGKKQAKKQKNEKPAAEATGSKSMGADTGRGDGYPPDNPSGSIPDASTDSSRSTSEGYGYYTAPSDIDDEIPF